ncbi:unnamed protein product, partial [Brassica rapa subsp. narinosa]
MLCGCVHALAIWIYESVPGLGEIYGHRIDGPEVPLLSWHGSRQRINFLNFCAQEKQQHQKKAFSIPELNDQSISTDDWENNLKWEKSVKCRQVLEALVSDVEPRCRRKQQLTKTQVWPFVGNPTVKRIITGVSKEPYDPLSKVDPDRKYWTSLSLIYKFLLCYPILLFLNKKLGQQFVTGKKWLADVDTLFLCHHVNNDHWVALRIDLVKEVIHVYDSIPSMVTDKKMHEECRPFRKMLPALLNKMVDGRTKRDKQFTFSR